MWTCPKCAMKVDESMDVCWRCGTDVDGVEDPHFVTAEDSPAIDDPPIESEMAISDEIAESIHDPIHVDLVECYLAGSALEAGMLAEELTAAGIPAMADGHDLQSELGFLGPEFKPRVRVRAEDLEPAREWLANYEADRKAKHDHS